MKKGVRTHGIRAPVHVFKSHCRFRCHYPAQLKHNLDKSPGIEAHGKENNDPGAHCHFYVSTLKPAAMHTKPGCHDPKIQSTSHHFGIEPRFACFGASPRTFHHDLVPARSVNHCQVWRIFLLLASEISCVPSHSFHSCGVQSCLRSPELEVHL